MSSSYGRLLDWTREELEAELEMVGSSDEDVTDALLPAFMMGTDEAVELLYAEGVLKRLRSELDGMTRP